MTALLNAVARFVESAQYIRRQRALTPIERHLEHQMQAAFRLQGRRFAAEYLRVRSKFVEASYEDLLRLFDLVEIATAQDMADRLSQGAASAVEAASKHRLADIRIAFAFSLRNPRAEAFLQQHAAARVTGINETTRGQIRDIITQGQRDGLNYDKIAKQISDRFEEFAVGKPQLHIQSRAHLVAITEAAEAYEEGNRFVIDEMTGLGLDMEKHWRDSGDAQVSAGCAENSAAGWIPADQPFPSGHQHSPRFPSCRCWIAYRRKPRT